MGITSGGTRTVLARGFGEQAGDRYDGVFASVESIPENCAVARVSSATTSGAGLGTVTKTATSLVADKVAGTGNASRDLDVITFVSTTVNVKVGDKIEIAAAAAGTVTEIISNTQVRVNASGTIAAGAYTYQRPAFAKVFPGATVVLATGPNTVTIASKTDDFTVTCVESGNVATGAITSFTNQPSICQWKSDGSRGPFLGVSEDAFVFSAPFSAANATAIRIKTMGGVDRTTLSCADYAAGSFPEALLVPLNLFHENTIKLF